MYLNVVVNIDAKKPQKTHFSYDTQMNCKIVHLKKKNYINIENQPEPKIE